MLSSVLSTLSDAQIPGRQPRSGAGSADSVSSFSQVFDGLAPRDQNDGAGGKSALEGGEADLLPVDDSAGLSEQPADLLADLPHGELATPPGSPQDPGVAPLTLERGEGAVDPPPPQASQTADPRPAEPLASPQGAHIARTKGAADASPALTAPAQGDPVLPGAPDKTGTPTPATPADAGAARITPQPDPRATTGPNATANPSADSETAAADAAKATWPAGAMRVAAGTETAAQGAEGGTPQANAAQGALAASTLAAAVAPKAARPVAAPAAQGATMHEGVTRQRDAPLTTAAASGARLPQMAEAGLRATPAQAPLQAPPEMANKPLLTDAGKPLAMVSDLMAATSRADPPPAPGVVTSEPVARQIAQALQTLPPLTPGATGRIEVVLSPAELGRVEITLTPKDAVTILSFSAERPETADLLRRNIDLLLDDLRRLGFGEAQLGFAGHRGQNSPRNPQFQPGGEGIAPVPLAQPPSDAPASGRLDLRM